MEEKHKISKIVAILVNLNIVIGAAFFIESPLISLRGGSLAPLSWLIVGLMLLPLVLSLSALAQQYPVAGGLYVYAQKELSPFWGFMSGWGYYIGTAAGNAVVLSSFSKQLVAMNLAGGLSGFILEGALVIFFSLINLRNIELLGTMQWIFTTLKAVPILLTVYAACTFFNLQNFPTVTTTQLQGVVGSIPLVLFAYLGIEACCAIGHVIKKGQKNAARVILISFLLIMSTYTILQICLIGIHGINQPQPFTRLVPMVTKHATVQKWGTLLVNIALLSSYLGGYYSMFYANNWNLYTMAKERSLPGQAWLTRCNYFRSPIIAIIIQTILIISFLWFTRNVAMLTTMSDFGIVIAYILSSIAFLQLKKRSKLAIAIGICALASCSYLLFVCYQELLKNGLRFALPFLIILTIGLLLHLISRCQRMTG